MKFIFPKEFTFGKLKIYTLKFTEGKFNFPKKFLFGKLKFPYIWKIYNPFRNFHLGEADSFLEYIFGA